MDNELKIFIKQLIDQGYHLTLDLKTHELKIHTKEPREDKELTSLLEEIKKPREEYFDVSLKLLLETAYLYAGIEFPVADQHLEILRLNYVGKGFPIKDSYVYRSSLTEGILDTYFKESFDIKDMSIIYGAIGLMFIPRIGYHWTKNRPLHLREIKANLIPCTRVPSFRSSSSKSNSQEIPKYELDKSEVDLSSLDAFESINRADSSRFIPKESDPNEYTSLSQLEALYSKEEIDRVIGHSIDIPTYRRISNSPQTYRYSIELVLRTFWLVYKPVLHFIEYDSIEKLTGLLQATLETLIQRNPSKKFYISCDRKLTLSVLRPVVKEMQKELFLNSSVKASSLSVFSLEYFQKLLLDDSGYIIGAVEQVERLTGRALRNDSKFPNWEENEVVRVLEPGL